MSSESPGSVEVQSETVEMLNVGEDILAIRSLVNVSERGSGTSYNAEGGSVPWKMGRGIPISIVTWRSRGANLATGVPTAAGTSSETIASSSPPRGS